MRKRKNTDVTNNDIRLLGVEELSMYLSLGRATAVRFAREAGAEKRIGKRCLYDKNVIDKKLDCSVGE